MEEIIALWEKNAAKNQERNFSFIRSLKFKSESKVDRLAREMHEEAFEKIDCLKCGNCCKVSKPLLSKADISRIAKHLNEPPRTIREKYLMQNEDGDWTINASPCPFLGEANECQIYSARPTNCKGFPYTHKSGFASRSYQHAANTIVCPAAYYVVERMKDIFRYR